MQGSFALSSSGYVDAIVSGIFPLIKEMVVISSLLKQVMQAHGLRQADLAELMGVPLDRIKSLTSGKAKNLKREEGQALVTKLHVRGDWLATGKGPMQQSANDLQALINPLSQDEQVLIDSYRRCTPQARQHLIQTAALLSAGIAAGGVTGGGQNQISHGSDTVQISGANNRVNAKCK